MTQAFPTLDITPAPDEVVFFDVETQSAANLREVGGRVYAADPTTRPLVTAFMIDARLLVWVPRYLWLEGPVPPLAIPPMTPTGYGVVPPITLHVSDETPATVSKAIKDNKVFVAHNLADFDFHVASRFWSPVPQRWYDTMPASRAAGFPGSLDDLGQAILGIGKDPAGRALVKKLCKYPYPRIQPALLLPLIRYAIADVLILRAVYQRVAGKGEADLIQHHYRLNARGVRFDVDLANRLIAMERAETEAINAQVRQLSGLELENTRSPQKVRKWLETKGIILPSLARKLLEQFLADPEADIEGVDVLFEGDLPEPVVQVIQARLLTSRIAAPKLARAVLSVGSDHRLRDLLVYHQAGTGRWAGRGFNVHNLPKPRVKKFPTEELFALHRDGKLTVDAIKRLGLSVSDAIGGLTRGCLLPSPGNLFLVADYAAIEARGVAWLASEQGLLKKFERDEDVYLDLASTLFGRPCTKADEKERGVGKIGILGCGYGMSAQKLSMNCTLDGIDLAAAGTSAEAVVDAYRNSYPAIAGYPAGVIADTGHVFRRDGLWQRLNDAAMDTIRTGRDRMTGRCLFRKKGADLVVQLPSGRELVYRLARMEDRVPGYCALFGLPANPKPTLVYQSARGETTMYGGKWAENLTQAICRDLLATVLLKAERAGLNPILHVHDELVCELPEETAADDLRRLVVLMSEPPSWADGFPIKVEGFTTPRYGKSPWRGSLVVEAINGRTVTEKRV
ncbi:MAG: DNA polymerase [Gemmataceae bacterium]